VTHKGHRTHISSTTVGSRVGSASYFGYTTSRIASNSHGAMFKALLKDDEFFFSFNVIATIDAQYQMVLMFFHYYLVL
jgi:hypothetical protein